MAADAPRPSWLPLLTAVSFCLAAAQAAEPAGVRAAVAPPSSSRLHVIELSEVPLCAEDGLLLGNGDLSVSIYRSGDCLIWRFGKGDVWDRRLDLSDDPRPVHITEVARGIRDEGWKAPPYGGPVQALHGTKNPQRMKEVCQGTPPSYKHRPYPCPKPVGELALHLPADQQGLKIRQRLVIEQATLYITCTWASGVSLQIESFIPPSPNVLVVHWRVSNRDLQTRQGNHTPAVWFSLYRWADPPLEVFAQQFFARYRHRGFFTYSDPKVIPLPPPKVVRRDDLQVLEQTLPATPLFPRGFRYFLAPFAPAASVAPADTKPLGEACLHLLPGPDAAEGWLAIAVPTTSDDGGAEAELARFRQALGEKPVARMKQWAQENLAAARDFWSRSRLQLGDDFLENLWYQTFYAKRCIYRDDTVPPGLFFPSTVLDYSHWHGDYHTNYNFQQPFWPDYEANHIDLGDAYFQGMKYLLQIGHKIARDYYGCRGVFIQLSGFPILARDDPLGVLCMGRMAYMTGWAVHQYWWRYLHTQDRQWLQDEGYPVLRDAALFYLDFLKKGDDGLYHAFPSNQGEAGLTGNPADWTDQGQVMVHARYCLLAAARASEELGLDEHLRAQWRERAYHLALRGGDLLKRFQGLDRHCAEVNPPEFGWGRPYRPQPSKLAGPSLFANRKNGYWTWYLGQFPWQWMSRLRDGSFVAERDLPVVRELLLRWRHPNGLLWAMAVANYGHCGAWTETLGIVAPLQEMLLQSWDGALRIFPAWPRGLDASFENLRAEGAFLVSASWAEGQLQEATVFSEKGKPCSVYSPWPGGLRVTDNQGHPVPLSADAYGRPTFATKAGHTYRLQPGPKK